MISKIPGYTPQVNVFSGMILAMIVITGLIVGIFIYIITIQKIRSLWNYASARDSDKNPSYGPFSVKSFSYLVWV